MSYSEEDWKNEVNTSSPVSHKKIEELETKVDEIEQKHLDRDNCWWDSSINMSPPEQHMDLDIWHPKIFLRCHYILYDEDRESLRYFSFVTSCLIIKLILLNIEDTSAEQYMWTARRWNTKNLGRLWLAYTELQVDFTSCNWILLTMGILHSYNSA